MVNRGNRRRKHVTGAGFGRGVSTGSAQMAARAGRSRGDQPVGRAAALGSGNRARGRGDQPQGPDHSRVDLEAAKEFKIWVTNQPGSNAVSVAELVFGQMIALVRHTHAANRAVKENRWSDYLKFIGTELAGKTLGIVGMGNIGARVALR